MAFAEQKNKLEFREPPENWRPKVASTWLTSGTYLHERRAIASSRSHFKEFTDPSRSLTPWLISIVNFGLGIATIESA